MRLPTPVLLAVVLAALPLAGENVAIKSSLDGAMQPALVDLPPENAAASVPLLVHLHSWSSRFDTSNNFADIRAEAKQRGWAFLSPDFRGANDHPEACGSELAVQDVLDAVEWVKQRAKIDPARIYLAGSSGGGYMSLVMAARAPEAWAGVSSWVPISDLQAWHAFSKEKNSRYWKMLDGCFLGKSPAASFAAQQYRRRSPIHFLRLAQGLPLDINTGIQDGHTGAVPVSHSLRAFNQLAAPADRIAEADIEAITRDAKIPAHLANANKLAESRAKTVLFHRASGAARVTVFDGGHEADFPAAVRWLEKLRKPDGAIHTRLQNDQLLPREADGKAAVPAPSAAQKVLVRVNAGAWQTAMPRLAAGGPYTIEFRSGAVTVRRTGILVGDLYVLGGQSNMVGRAPLTDPAPPDPRVRNFTAEDVWTVARDPIHEAIPRDGRTIGIGLGFPFAKEMVRRTGVPVGLIPCAVGGTSLAEWSPELRGGQFRRSLYGNCLARIKLAGGAVKAVLWYQGEADASSLETASTYATRFADFVRTIRSDTGLAQLPFYWAQLSRHVNPKGNSEGWEIVREAQRLSEAAIPASGVVATIDLTLTDPIHVDRTGLETLGRRFAMRILDGPAPRLASATWEGTATLPLLRLKFEPRLVAVPRGSRIHGFDLDEPAVFHAVQDPASGDLVLSVAPSKSGQSRSLYYCRGLNPACGALADARGRVLPAFGPVKLDAATLR